MKIDEVLKNLKGIPIVSEISRGIERECLRVTSEGRISKNSHSKPLGCALTHPFITTDYSEALLEFVTPVFNDPKKLLRFLKDLHVYTISNIGDDILWNNSMPCFFAKEDTIPIALYGNSNLGKMKEVYRHGLKNRYGDAMQTISGIHFNFSLSDSLLQKVKEITDDKQHDFKTYKSKKYMSVTRNIHRYSWLIPYLLGSSPAICKSFLRKSLEKTALIPFDDLGTLTYQGATSLRLSNLGYTNEGQNSINMCFNDIQSYIKSLKTAITTPDENYAQMTLLKDGNYQQLNSNILQLENEYYAEVRPKQPIKSGESPTNALLDRGIKYIELRSVDVNTFSPVGLDLEQILFLDVFLLFCLFCESDFLCPNKTIRFRKNQEMVAMHGRQIDFSLYNGIEEVNALDWAKNLFEKFSMIAEQLDTETGKREYTNAINRYAYKLIIPRELNSARLMDEMKDKGESFYHNTLNRSLKFSQELKESSLSSGRRIELENIAKQSHIDQKEIEDNDKIPFEEYLKNYFTQNN